MDFLLFYKFTNNFFHVNLFAVCVLCDLRVELRSRALSCCKEGFFLVALLGRVFLCGIFMRRRIANGGRWCFESF